MNFKYINNEGKEIEIDSLGLFIKLIKSGQIKCDTLIYDNQNSVWKKASDFEEFQSILENIEQTILENDNVSLQQKAETISNEKNIKSADVPLIIKDKRRPLLFYSSIVLLFISTGMIIFKSIIESPGIDGIAIAVGTAVGTMLGYYPFILIPSYLIWRFIFQKKIGNTLFFFSIICFIVSINAYVNTIKMKNESKKVVKEMLSDFGDIINGKVIKKRDFNNDNEVYKNLAPLIKISNDYAWQLQNDFIKMNGEIEEQQIETILTKQTLENPQKIAQAQERLKNIYNILNKYENLLKQRQGEADRKINNLELQIDLKKEVLASYNKEKNQNNQNMAEFFRIEKSIISEIDNLLEFLKRKKGSYWFEGENIQFLSQKDITAYNNYIINISNLIEEEKSWQVKVQNKKSKMSKDLKKLQDKVNR